MLTKNKSSSFLVHVSGVLGFGWLAGWRLTCLAAASFPYWLVPCRCSGQVALPGAIGQLLQSLRDGKDQLPITCGVDLCVALPGTERRQVLARVQKQVSELLSVAGPAQMVQLHGLLVFGRAKEQLLPAAPQTGAVLRSSERRRGVIAFSVRHALLGRVHEAEELPPSFFMSSNPLIKVHGAHAQLHQHGSLGIAPVGKARGRASHHIEARANVAQRPQPPILRGKEVRVGTRACLVAIGSPDLGCRECVLLLFGGNRAGRGAPNRSFEAIIQDAQEAAARPAPASNLVRLLIEHRLHHLPPIVVVRRGNYLLHLDRTVEADVDLVGRAGVCLCICGFRVLGSYSGRSLTLGARY